MPLLSKVTVFRASALYAGVPQGRWWAPHPPMTQLPLELMTPKLPLAQAFPGLQTHYIHPLDMSCASPPGSHPTHPKLSHLLPQTCPLPMFTTSRMALQVRKQGPSGPFSGPCPINPQRWHPHCPPPAHKDTHTSHFHVLLQPPRGRAQLLTALHLYVPLLQFIFHVQPKRHFQRAAPTFLSLFCPLVLSPFVLLHAGHSQLKAPMPSGRGLNSFTW